MYFEVFSSLDFGRIFVPKEGSHWQFQSGGHQWKYVPTYLVIPTNFLHTSIFYHQLWTILRNYLKICRQNLCIQKFTFSQGTEAFHKFLNLISSCDSLLYSDYFYSFLTSEEHNEAVSHIKLGRYGEAVNLLETIFHIREKLLTATNIMVSVPTYLSCM